MKGVRLKERMAGYIQFSPEMIQELHLDLDSQNQYPYEFTICAFLERWSYPLQLKFKGQASFTGIIFDAKRGIESMSFPIEGKMQISHRGVSYDYELNFLGKMIHLTGKKNYHYSPNLALFKKSLITLPFQGECDGKPCLQGEMMYHEPLFHFPFGLRLTDQQFAYQPRLKESDKLCALAGMLAPDYLNFNSEDKIIKSLEKQLESLPYIFYLYLKFMRKSFSLLTWLSFFKKPSQLNDSEKKSMLHWIQRHSFLTVIYLSLFLFVMGAVLDDEKVLKKLDQHIPQTPKENESEPWMRMSFIPHRSMTEEIEADVVVVGAGAGGGAIAYELSRLGHAVCLVEEGHYFKRVDLTGKRLEMMRKLYRQQGMSFAVSSAPIWLPTGKGVGGTTLINSGTSMRPPRQLLSQWEKNLQIVATAWDPLFESVEKMLHTSIPEKHLRGPIESVLSQALSHEQNKKLFPLSRAALGCDGQGYCILGCPVGAKSSTDVSYVPAALKNNTFLFSHYRVEKVLFKNNQAYGVEGHLAHYGKYFPLKIKAKKIILSAGTFNTPQLLIRSGIKNAQIGKNLTIHPAISVGAVFDRVVRSSHFIPQSIGVESDQWTDFILEAYTIPADTYPVAFAAFGEQFTEMFSRLDRSINFAAMFKDVSKGYLKINSLGAFPVYPLSSQQREHFRTAIIEMGQLFFKAGALSLDMPILGMPALRSIQALQQLKQQKISSHRYVLSAHHPLGTCQMGMRPDASVTDHHGKVWGVSNLFVADGSGIPGPLGVNPQVMIMSNALRVAQYIHQELS